MSMSRAATALTKEQPSSRGSTSLQQFISEDLSKDIINYAMNEPTMFQIDYSSPLDSLVTSLDLPFAESHHLFNLVQAILLRLQERPIHQQLTSALKLLLKRLESLENDIQLGYFQQIFNKFVQVSSELVLETLSSQNQLLCALKRKLQHSAVSGALISLLLKDQQDQEALNKLIEILVQVMDFEEPLNSFLQRMVSFLSQLNSTLGIEEKTINIQRLLVCIPVQTLFVLESTFSLKEEEWKLIVQFFNEALRLARRSINDIRYSKIPQLINVGNRILVNKIIPEIESCCTLPVVSFMANITFFIKEADIQLPVMAYYLIAQQIMLSFSWKTVFNLQAYLILSNLLKSRFREEVLSLPESRLFVTLMRLVRQGRFYVDIRSGSKYFTQSSAFAIELIKEIGDEECNHFEWQYFKSNQLADILRKTKPDCVRRPLLRREKRFYSVEPV